MLVAVKRATVTSKILTRDFTSKNVSHRKTGYGDIEKQTRYGKTRKHATVTSKISTRDFTSKNVSHCKNALR